MENLLVSPFATMFDIQTIFPNVKILKIIFSSSVFIKANTLCFNLTLSLMQMLSDASAADGFLKTLCNKRRNCIKTCNFSFCNNVFHFLSQVIHSIMEILYVLTKYVQSRPLQNCRMKERVKMIVVGVRFGANISTHM